MTTDIKGNSRSVNDKLTFICKYCKKEKSFKDMVVVTRYFPQLVICRDCEKHLR